MKTKKPIVFSQESASPKALIIGGGKHAEHLSSILSSNGCEVVQKSRDVTRLGRFDYIFLFGFAAASTQVRKRHLLSSGKIVIIETDEEDAQEEAKKNRAWCIRAGSLASWNAKMLTDTILSAVFGSVTAATIDVRKDPPPPPVVTLELPVNKSEVSNLSQVILDGHTSQKKTQVVSSVHARPFHTPKNKHHRFLTKTRLVVISLVFTVFGFGVCGIWYMQYIQTMVTQLRSHVASSSWSEAEEDLSGLHREAARLKSIYSTVTSALFPLRSISYVRDTGVLLDQLELLSRTSEDTLRFFRQFVVRKGDLFADTFAITQADIDESMRTITHVAQTLVEAKKQMESVKIPIFPKETVSAFLTATLTKVASVRDTIPLVAQLLLHQSPKTYLLLFQNNMELRPTGGFIGSYGLLSVYEGRITSFTIHDVYTADGQLKGHVDPPDAIRKYMNQPNWFLRDSNFDPDFSLSAQQAEWFLEKETGIRVDGVIGIDLFFLESLLRSVGPLTITDFGNEVITADNFFFKAQRNIQKDFFAGSSQKKDFLTSVSRALLNELTNTSKRLPFDFFLTLRKALDEKHVLLYIHEETTQKEVEQKGWGGRLVEVSCVGITSSCFADYLAIVEANLGVNKANYFVQKSIVVGKRIEKDGTLTTTIVLSYENKGIPDVFGGGTYVNYLRIFVPSGAHLVAASVNTRPITGAQIEEGTYASDKSMFAYLLRVGEQNKGVISITYTVPKKLSNGDSSYQFFFQKQSGDKTSPFVLSMEYPPFVVFQSTNFASKSERERELVYTTDTSVDRIFAFTRAR